MKRLTSLLVLIILITSCTKNAGVKQSEKELEPRPPEIVQSNDLSESIFIEPADSLSQIGSKSIIFQPVASGKSILKRVYLKNSLSSSLSLTMSSLATAISGSPFSVVKNTCTDNLLINKICYIDFSLIHSDTLSYDPINFQIYSSQDSTDFGKFTLVGSKQSAIAPNKSVQFTKIGQLSDLNSDKSIRIYLKNQGDIVYDPSLTIPPEYQVVRSTCVGTLKTNAACYVDLKIKDTLDPNIVGVNKSINYDGSTFAITAGSGSSPESISCNSGFTNLSNVCTQTNQVRACLSQPSNSTDGYEESSNAGQNWSSCLNFDCNEKYIIANGNSCVLKVAISGSQVIYTDSNGLNPSATPYVDGYVVHKFLNPVVAGSIALTGTSLNLEYIAVGGGGGSAFYSGGGGAGGFLSGSLSLGSESSTAVSVGAGGLSYVGLSPALTNYGLNGGDSILGSITAKGGGGGGGGWAGLIPTPVRQPTSGFNYSYSPLYIWQLDGGGNATIYWNGSTIASGLPPGTTQHTSGSSTYYKGSFAAGTDYRIYRIETQNIPAIGSVNGRNGGSGGGGGNSEGASIGGSPEFGQGFKGGDGTSGTAGTRGGSGGGGASEPGGNGAVAGGNGGDGVSSTISGVLTYYAGGGGGNGGGTPTGLAGLGGLGGGGNGGEQILNGTNGSSNTGGGAGGGGGGTGAAIGGSGIVIIRYPYASAL